MRQESEEFAFQVGWEASGSVLDLSELIFGLSQPVKGVGRARTATFTALLGNLTYLLVFLL